MSGIYIPDMELPKSCSDCRFCAGKWCYVIPEYEWQIDSCRPDRRPDWCPLIPVPDHGRLIDADAMRASIPPCYTMEEIVKAFKHAPTILPAEKEGEE